MKKMFSLILAALLLFIISACGTNNTTGTDTESKTDDPKNEGVGETEEITVTHLLGETVVSKNPEKVVVFDFGVLDSLDKMGVEIAGIPQANVPPYLAKYEDAKYFNAGSLKEPDFEAIANYGADLIIISTRQQELYDEFTKLGPTIFLGIDNSKYMESFTSNMKVLGEIFDKEDFIEQELAKIDESIAQLKEKATNVENVLIVLANEGNISAYGPGSRFGIVHETFDLTPVDNSIEVSTHGMNISYEYLVEKDPEYLFVIDRGMVVAGGDQTAENTIENELTEKTRAFKENKIVYLDPNYWYLSGGGLVSVIEMINEISSAIK